MTDAGKEISGYVEKARLMQLATVENGSPWVCTVYFVPDAQGKLYWLSYPWRRHSREIAEDDNVAVAVAIKHDQPVMGLQAEGRAEVVTDADTVRRVMAEYVKKYGAGDDFYDRFQAGTNEHHLYCFIPEHVQVFDEVNFPGGPKQYTFEENTTQDGF